MKPLPKEPGPIIRMFVREAEPRLKAAFADTRCLNSTRVCLEVMRMFNVRAQPLSVQAIAMNQLYIEKMDQLGRLPTSEELPGWIREGAWALGTDTNPDATDTARNAWAGHLVAIVQDWLVDAGAIQMSRPQKKMAMPDIFVGETTPRFLKGKGAVVFQSGEGARLTYNARLDDESWKTIDGFQPSKWNIEVAVEIANAMAVRMGRRPSFKATPIHDLDPDRPALFRW